MAAGGRVTGSVSGKPDYLVAGETPGWTKDSRRRSGWAWRCSTKPASWGCSTAPEGAPARVCARGGQD